jgi:oligopeptide/dipeptide ABC transporter ATP-binding protein
MLRIPTDIPQDRSAREPAGRFAARDRNAPVLEVRDLAVRFYQDEGTVRAVNGVDLRLYSGKSIGVVGESGCGKTVTAYSILRILPRTARITSGEILLRRADGAVVDLASLKADGGEMRSVRGQECAIIFQEPMTAFSPVHSICNQISEAIRLHQTAGKAEARRRVIELLSLVGIPDAERAVDAYPFQLSGGMRQRAMIAMALACNPRILIADEPTTALDVTIQAQVLRLIRKLQQELNLSLMLITHNLGVVAHMVDYVYVMYLGRVVEEGPVARIFDAPAHPYTRALLRSVPRLSHSEEALVPIGGSVPDPYSYPSGCPFHPRCPSVIQNVCARRFPNARSLGPSHSVSCFLYGDEDVDDGSAADEQ